MGCRLLLFQYKTRLFPLSFPSNSSPPSLSLSLHNPSLLRHLPPPSPPSNSKLRYCFMCFSFCFLFVSWVSIFWIFLFVWTVIPENRNSRVLNSLCERRSIHGTTALCVYVYVRIQKCSFWFTLFSIFTHRIKFRKA